MTGTRFGPNFECGTESTATTYATLYEHRWKPCGGMGGWYCEKCSADDYNTAPVQFGCPAKEAP